jgi:hypothetical protein
MWLVGLEAAGSAYLAAVPVGGGSEHHLCCQRRISVTASSMMTESRRGAAEAQFSVRLPLDGRCALGSGLGVYDITR